jgi:hypothetical protein
MHDIVKADYKALKLRQFKEGKLLEPVFEL